MTMGNEVRNYAASGRVAESIASTPASRSRSSGLTRKPSMPAARQASRSSASVGGERDDRRARAAAFGFGGADAARGLEAVDAGHVHVHQHEVVGRAGRARREPGLDRGGAVLGDGRAMAEPCQQRARQQRVDLVVLGDQDRAAGRRADCMPPRASVASTLSRSKSSGAVLKRAASEAARSGLTR